jgi:hypothetical protein
VPGAAERKLACREGRAAAERTADAAECRARTAKAAADQLRTAAAALRAQLQDAAAAGAAQHAELARLQQHAAALEAAAEAAAAAEAQHAVALASAEGRTAAAEAAQASARMAADDAARRAAASAEASQQLQEQCAVLQQRLELLVRAARAMLQRHLPHTPCTPLAAPVAAPLLRGRGLLLPLSVPTLAQASAARTPANSTPQRSAWVRCSVAAEATAACCAGG